MNNLSSVFQRMFKKYGRTTVMPKKAKKVGALKQSGTPGEYLKKIQALSVETQKMQGKK